MVPTRAREVEPNESAPFVEEGHSHRSASPPSRGSVADKTAATQRSIEATVNGSCRPIHTRVLLPWPFQTAGPESIVHGVGGIGDPAGVAELRIEAMAGVDRVVPISRVPAGGLGMR